MSKSPISLVCFVGILLLVGEACQNGSPPPTTTTVVFNVSSSAASLPIPNGTTVTVALTNSSGAQLASTTATAQNGSASVTVSGLPPATPFTYTVSAVGFVSSSPVSDQTGAAGTTKTLSVSLAPAPVNYGFLTGENSFGTNGALVTLPIPAQIVVTLDAGGTVVSPNGFATSPNGLSTTYDLATLSLLPGTKYDFVATETAGQKQQLSGSFTTTLSGQSNNTTTIVFGPSGSVTSKAVTNVHTNKNPRSSAPNPQPPEGTPIKVLPPPSR
jgi:hypothetical protein